MGSSQSVLSSETAVTLVVVAGVLGAGYTFRPNTALPPPPPAKSTDTQKSQAGTKNKKKKKKGVAAVSGDDSAARSVTPQPSTSAQADSPAKVASVVPEVVVPGRFNNSESETPAAAALLQSQTSATAKSKKTKKKLKAKQQAAEAEPESSATEQPRAPSPRTQAAAPTKAQKQAAKTSPLDMAASLASVDTDGSWTRVSSSRRGASHQKRDSNNAATISDAGLTNTSATGNSSPVAERTEDDAFSAKPRGSGENNKRTLAEKLLPKARKTGVEDLLEEPDVPTLSRVMRIKPGPDEKPASGFSWADYEDVRVAEAGEHSADADGEDEGWDVVKTRKPKTERQASSNHPQASSSSAKSTSTPEAQTKRQRQNTQKREAQKDAKALAEEERLAALARHKRELERVRMAEQAKAKSSSSGKTVSGGMQASVSTTGKLVWE